MKIRFDAKWMALLVAGSCVGCASNSGSQSPGMFASWTNPFSSMASKSPSRQDEQDDAIRLDKKPNATADFFIAAGRLAESRHDQQTALAQYKHAVKKEPKNVNAHRHLAQLHERMEHYSEAEAVYAAAIAAAPTDPTPLNDLAQCLARQQRYDESIEKLNKAIAMRPHETLYRNNMAKILVKAGRPREAFEHLTQVHSVAESHYNLGYMLRDSGDLGSARQHAISAIQVDPNFEPAHLLLEEIGGAMPQTAQRPSNRTPSKEVAVPRNLRAQGPAKSEVRSDNFADEMEPEAEPVAPKGYYEGTDGGEKSAAPPAEVLAKLPKKKPVRKSTAELRSKIEDSAPVLR